MLTVSMNQDDALHEEWRMCELDENGLRILLGAGKTYRTNIEAAYPPKVVSDRHHSTNRTKQGQPLCHADTIVM